MTGNSAFGSSYQWLLRTLANKPIILSITGLAYDW